MIKYDFNLIMNQEFLFVKNLWSLKNQMKKKSNQMK